MTARHSATVSGLRTRHVSALFACLAVAACAASPPPTRWVKAGADEATTTRELEACRRQADAVLARQQGIDADITATLGGNWQRSSTLGIESQSLNSSAQGLAQRSLENCMLAKGFAKVS
jgi:hypothetical protein